MDMFLVSMTVSVDEHLLVRELETGGVHNDNGNAVHETGISTAPISPECVRWQKRELKKTNQIIRDFKQKRKERQELLICSHYAPKRYRKPHYWTAP